MIEVKVKKEKPVNVEVIGQAIKGDKGEPFRYEDFTPEQLAALKGPKGDPGHTPVKGVDYFDGAPGDDYVITSADYEAIADIAKDRVDLAEYAKTDYVDAAIEGLELVEVVTELPAQGKKNKTYLLAKADGSDTDIYDEYVWIGDRYELIGTKKVEVDLTDYVKNTDYASSAEAGVFRTSGSYGVVVSGNGYLQSAQAKTYEQYQSADVRMLVGKGTLDNVLDGKGYITADDIPNKDTYIVTGYMTGVPSGTVRFNVYKNGEPCTESLYLDLYYSAKEGSKPTTKSSRSGYYDGAYESSYSSSYGYLANWYTDESKAEFLCGVFVNYGLTGEQGDSYTLTEADKTEIAEMVEVPTQSKYVMFKDLTADIINDCLDGNVSLFVNRDDFVYRLTGINTGTAYFSSFTTNKNRAFTMNLKTNKPTTISTYTIPTDAHVNELIDAKLGVIENGTY